MCVSQICQDRVLINAGKLSWNKHVCACMSDLSEPGSYKFCIIPRGNIVSGNVGELSQNKYVLACQIYWNRVLINAVLPSRPKDVRVTVGFDESLKENPTHLRCKEIK